MYDYSKVQYVNMNTKVIIICPEHGEFIKTPSKHIYGRQGCQECSKVNTNRLTTTKQDFLTKAKLVHGNKYEYSKVVYKGVDKKVTITCPIHGDFSQSPEKHCAGRNCPECAALSRRISKTKSTLEFIQDAKAIHGDKYTYENVIYTKAVEHVSVTCPTHGDWSQTPNGHLSGYGCPDCANTGRDWSSSTIPGTLYYLRVIGTDLHKIGITTKEITHRYRTSIDRESMEILYTKTFAQVGLAYKLEQSVLKKFGKFKYRGDKVLSSGNTELFTKDIFEGEAEMKLNELEGYLNE